MDTWVISQRINTQNWSNEIGDQSYKGKNEELKRLIFWVKMRVAWHMWEMVKGKTNADEKAYQDNKEVLKD